MKLQLSEVHLVQGTIVSTVYVHGVARLRPVNRWPRILRARSCIMAHLRHVIHVDQLHALEEAGQQGDETANLVQVQ
eukprot:Skav236224  [mRNA]  locus=scaffold132:106994:109322:- [translate_table: standard]